MALITCPDCSTEVSDQAAACPKCGRPAAKAQATTEKTRASSGSALTYPGLATLVVGAILYFFMGSGANLFTAMGGMLAMLAGGVMYVYGLIAGGSKASG